MLHQLDKLLLWNWAPADVGRVKLRLHGTASSPATRCVRLDAQPPVLDDNACFVSVSMSVSIMFDSVGCVNNSSYLRTLHGIAN